MLIEKIYAVTIDVHDPEDYCVRPDEYILTHLRRRFTGRNHQGAHIVKILKILRRSDCRIKETNLSGEGYIDVKFLARVMALGLWDIVTGVLVTSLTPLTVGKAMREEGKLLVNVLPKLPKFGGEGQGVPVRLGQTVAVRISSIIYPPDQRQATIVGPLLTCDLSAPAFLLATDLTEQDALTLEPLATRVRAQLKTRAALVKTRREDVFFFETLLYAYAFNLERPQQAVESAEAEPWVGPGGVDLPTGVTAVNLLSLLSGARRGGGKTQGVWCRDLSLYRSSPLAAFAAEPLPQWAEPLALPPLTAFTAMLQTVHEFAKAVNEMVETYTSQEHLNEHKNIWLAMRSVQSTLPQHTS